MRQYLLPDTFEGEDHVLLTGKESQYLVKVLRLKIAQHFMGRDREGKVWDLCLESIGKNNCVLGCRVPDAGEPLASTDVLPSYSGPYPHLFLYQCLCKGKKNEQIVRQATELGVEEIVLLTSTYCTKEFSKKNDKNLGGQKDRLEGQIKEAIQQSGSPIPTHLHQEMLPLTSFPQHWNNRGLALFFHQSERADQKSLTQLLSNHPIESPVALLVGSEGGFSEEECNFLEAAGCKPVLLNTNILRAETAALYGLSAIQVVLTEREN